MSIRWYSDSVHILNAKYQKGFSTALLLQCHVESCNLKCKTLRNKRGVEWMYRIKEETDITMILLSILLMFYILIDQMRICRVK